MGHDQNHQVHTISSQPVRRSTSQALAVTLTAAERQRVAATLTALSSHYWRPDFSPAQAGMLIADYCADLSACRVDEIEVACREYRLNPKNQFFPKSAQLREIIFANRKHREELDKLGAPVKVDSRPIRWWSQSRKFWQPHWREADVPAGEKIKDPVTGAWREPERDTEIPADRKSA